MRYTCNRFLLSIFIFLIPHNALGNESEQQSFTTRVWNIFFGSSDKTTTPECPNCQNGSPQHIENAHWNNGTGKQKAPNAASPTTITNFHGNPASQLSEEALMALEREKTRQLELANAHELQKEHERDRWFNTLVQYIDERWTNQSEKQKTALFEQAQIMLAEHHRILERIEKEKGKTVLQKERIRQENLPTLLQHDLEKNKLLHHQAMEKLGQIGNGFYTFTGDKQRMATTAFTLSCIALGVYTSKRGTKVAADYAAAILMKPSLVTETSRLTINQLLRHPIATMLRRKKELPEMIYNKDLQIQVQKYVHAIRENKKDRQPPIPALFYGSPGTGKTLLARKIAHELDMPYAIIPGSNIYQFGEGAVKELNRLFNWAQKNRVVLFFDEVDALAPRRSDTNVSELARKIQNTLYARTGTEADQFLMLGATNTPKLLDPALVSRYGQHIEFSLPDQQTRLKLLHFYFDTYVKKGSRMHIDHDIETVFDSIAHAIEGFSGRDIMQLTRAFRAEAYSAENKVTSSLLNQVVKQKIEQRANLKNYSSMEVPD